MPLFDLPAETLHAIFAHVGTAFFHEDVQRLTVSKLWFAFALPQCLRRVDLTGRSLHLFVGRQKHQEDDQARRQTDIFNTVTGPPIHSLSLSLQGYPGYDDADADADWVHVLDHDVARLATMVAQRTGRRLRQLRIKAKHSAYAAKHCDDDDEDGHGILLYNYVPGTSLQCLLRSQLQRQLHTLILDLSVGYCEGYDRCHLCPFIAALLPSLTTLHVRLCRMCPEIVRLDDDHNDHHLRLSEVVLNLVSRDRRSYANPVGRVLHCSRRLRATPLEDALFDAARRLVRRMGTTYDENGRKTVRILTDLTPAPQVLVLDCVAGKKRVLTEGMPWNAEGKVLE